MLKKEKSEYKEKKRNNDLFGGTCVILYLLKYLWKFNLI